MDVEKIEKPSVMLVNSVLRFQLIYIYSSYSINMDSGSELDANGTGAMEGLGWGIITNSSDSTVQSGGSFGGQGGGSAPTGSPTPPQPTTYGRYDQEFDPELDLSTFLGSGGGVN